MRTEAHIAASRANGAKSRAVTTIGRAISARNSTAHGLAGAKLIVIEGASTDASSLLEPSIANSNRKTEIETELVTEIPAARWRLRHYWSMETSLFDMDMAKQRENPEFETLDYESQHAPPETSAEHAHHGPLRDAHAPQLRTRRRKSLPAPRPPENRKFPNEPKNSGE